MASGHVLILATSERGEVTRVGWVVFCLPNESALLSEELEHSAALVGPRHAIRRYACTFQLRRDECFLLQRHSVEHRVYDDFCSAQLHHRSVNVCFVRQVILGDRYAESIAAEAHTMRVHARAIAAFAEWYSF